MGRDISYRNNATLCVNRLEESVRVFSMGHLSVFWDFINPVASNKSIEIFGSRVLISRKHSYVGLDLTKVKHFVWESIWLEEDGDGVYGFLFAFCRPSLVLQLECFADTERCQILMALNWKPSLILLMIQILQGAQWAGISTGEIQYLDLIFTPNIAERVCDVTWYQPFPPQMAWYLAGGTCTNGSDHIDRRSPWEVL